MQFANHILIISLADDSGRSVCSNDFMPFTTRKTIARMAQNIVNKPTHECDLASLICVTAYAAYFLQEIVLSSHSDHTGFEEQLRLHALEYFSTARSATPHLLIQAPATLENLQALIYGVCSL